VLTVKTLLIALPFLAIAGFFLGYFYRRNLMETKLGFAEKQATRIVEESRKEAENLKKAAALEAKEHLYQAKADCDKEAKEKRGELNNLEKRLAQKEENLERKVDLIDRKELDLNKREGKIGNREKSVADREQEYQERLQEVQRKLEKVSDMTT